MSEIEYITGRSYDECLGKLKSLYGNNFQVVRKKFVNKGGFLGFFQHEAIQVSYIVTEKIPSLYTPAAVRREPERNFDEERAKILGLSRTADGTYTQTGAQPAAVQKASEEDDASSQKILDELKSLKKDISAMKASGPADEDPDTIIRIRTMLEDNEFSPAFIRAIVERIRQEFSLTELEDYAAVEKAVISWIGDSICIDDVEARERPKIIILVGPTGVGKTTTVAKLAARFAPPSKVTSDHQKVRIITIDNFRIGGKEQIEKFANLMGISVDSCSNAEELEKKVVQYAPDTDTILIDTIGFSPRDNDHIGKMKKILELQGLKTVVYLAMMASTKASDMREIMHQYELFGYDDVIITKLDETGCVGNLISIVSEKGKKFAWYTTGQRVPADIETASVAKLTGMLRGIKKEMTDSQLMFPAE